MYKRQLQNELARIRAERGLPWQILERQPPAGGPDDLTAAALGAFNSVAEIDRLHRSLDEMWPYEALDFPPVSLEHARRLIARYRPASDLFLMRLRQPTGEFRVGLDQGIVEDTSWVSAALLIARIEVLEAIRAVQEGVPDKSIEPLSDLARLVLRMERCPSLVAHLAAVDIRRWIVCGMRAAAMSDQANRNTHQLLFELSSADRRERQDGRLAWIGDRAAGMHAYEMVRAGEFLSLLSDEEYQALSDRRETMDHALVVRRNVDQDQTYFLKTMRELIERTPQPYYERRVWLDETFEALDRDRAAPRFPSVAADLLLIGITTAQQRLARGTARSDAWHLALAAAIEQPLTEPPTVNVETGEAFEVLIDGVLIDGVRIEVRGLHEDDYDLLPILVRHEL